jgi:hypothetical protein|tara:strand:+ start:568 stop:765 length:198 start_codon:yes stop_codon:yes gene_type:complete
MDFGIPQKINTFDDGNQIYKYMPNAWIIIGSQFNGQKVKLKNKIDEKIIINSISSWKLSPITIQS